MKRGGNMSACLAVLTFSLTFLLHVSSIHSVSSSVDEALMHVAHIPLSHEQYTLLRARVYNASSNMNADVSSDALTHSIAQFFVHASFCAPPNSLNQSAFSPSLLFLPHASECALQTRRNSNVFFTLPLTNRFRFRIALFSRPEHLHVRCKYPVRAPCKLPLSNAVPSACTPARLCYMRYVPLSAWWTRLGRSVTPHEISHAMQMQRRARARARANGSAVSNVVVARGRSACRNAVSALNRVAGSELVYVACMHAPKRYVKACAGVEHISSRNDFSQMEALLGLRVPRKGRLAMLPQVAWRNARYEKEHRKTDAHVERLLGEINVNEKEQLGIAPVNIMPNVRVYCESEQCTKDVKGNVRHAPPRMQDGNELPKDCDERDRREFAVLQQLLLKIWTDNNGR